MPNNINFLSLQHTSFHSTAHFLLTSRLPPCQCQAHQPYRWPIQHLHTPSQRSPSSSAAYSPRNFRRWAGPAQLWLQQHSPIKLKIHSSAYSAVGGRGYTLAGCSMSADMEAGCCSSMSANTIFNCCNSVVSSITDRNLSAADTTINCRSISFKTGLYHFYFLLCPYFSGMPILQLIAKQQPQLSSFRHQ